MASQVSLILQMTSKNDHEILVNRFKQGDETAFDEIVLLFQDEIASLVNRLLIRPDNTDDVVQDVFLAVYLNLKRFRNESNLKSWIFRIVINKCRSKHRKDLLRLKLLRKVIPKMEISIVNTMPSEAHQAVHSTIAKLPLKYREPIVLKYMQEMPTDQVCKILKITSNTLNVRLSRARQQLKQKLTRWID